LAADQPEPRLVPGEALINVRLAGICNTDLEIARGYMGYQGVLGHEFVGIVEQAGTPELIGKRVVGEINCVCGVCDLCKRNLSTHCPNRTTFGIFERAGALAERTMLPEVNLHIVPDSVSDEEAVFTEPLAAALQILEQIQICPTNRVVVLGDGKLGLLAAQVVALTGADVVVYGRHWEKLDILGQRGIKVRLAQDTLADNMAGWADVVIECTGQASGLETAKRLVRPRGTIVLKSTYAGDMRFAFSPLVVDEISIVCSRCGPFAPTLRLLERQMITVKPLISAVYPLEQGEEAFRVAGQKGSMKVLVKV
jgi:threonine dehydrogenase-like Zn-dependent dehydrogenase